MTTTHLVAFVRDGLAASVNQLPSPTAALRAPMTARAQVVGAGQPIIGTAPGLELAGPGDVIALHEAQIAGRFPAPDASGVDPTSFAWIEFHRPDLPWLFTPFAPVGNRLQPWLVLLVLREDEATLRRVDAIWRLRVTNPAALPDLSHSYAWAHAQFTRSGPDTVLPPPPPLRGEAFGEGASARSRLLCPRRLGDRQRYVACLVPSFRASVTAAFALQPRAATIELGPAWPAPHNESDELPIYAHWRFETGPGERFEDLVQNLQRPDQQLALGRRDLDASDPGSGITPSAAPLRLAQDGVLRPANPAPPVAAPALSASIAARLDQPGRLCPPTYGIWHAAARAAAQSSAPAWLPALNHEPIRRVAAALGTQIVQRHQETFMAACWEQAGEVLHANRQLRLGEMAQAAAASLRMRRLAPLLNGRADGLALVAYAAPALPRLRFRPGLTFLGAMRPSCLPPLAVSGAARKLLRPGGPLQRRLSRRTQPDTRTPIAPEDVLDALANNRLPDRAPPLSGARTVSVFLLGAEWHPQPFPFRWPILEPDRPLQPVLPSHPLHAVVEQYTSIVSSTRPVACRPLPTAGARSFARDLWAALDPAVTLPRRVRARVKVPSTLATSFDGLRPILVAPRLPAPMADYLLELSREWLVPGLAGMPSDSIVLLQPNPKFIESYMVGLNHEMARELLWRGFPTDQRGTVFDSFWRADDRAVPPLHGWSGALGTHLKPSQAALTVLVLRGQLVRRFPRATIYLHARDAATMQPKTGQLAAGDRVLPSFDRLLEPDTRLVGFAIATDAVATYYLVFQEEPQTLRFGRTTVAEHAWKLPVGADDSASFAAKCVYPPVRLYVLAERLL